jgi:isoaspartyl peptidase/L-asparaginase-like protein (Ntn-hydrolase superfamily)
MADYVVVATWPFGMEAVKAAAALLQQGTHALDAAIAGAQVVEDDPKVHSVGYGGIGNAVGTVQRDACVMDGSTLSCGAVAGVENIRHAAAVARRVMEKTPHILLVGEGARLFAVQQGFPLQNLNTPESVAEWEKVLTKTKAQPAPGAKGSGTSRGADGRKPEAGSAVASNFQQTAASRIPSPEYLPLPPYSHDTIAVLAQDTNGSFGGVCTTSGLALKVPGRVGDSPLIGHGLYVDNTAGAAGATGVGEEVIRIAGSTMVIEAMRAGKSAQEACEQAVRKVNQVAVRRGVHPAAVAFLALDRSGGIGAACTERTNFHYAVARPGKVELLKGREIGVQG